MANLRCLPLHRSKVTVASLTCFVNGILLRTTRCVVDELFVILYFRESYLHWIFGEVGRQYFKVVPLIENCCLGLTYPITNNV
jgi:hypothetical protein